MHPRHGMMVAMTARQKKLLSNLLFAGGFLLAALGVLLTATGGEVLMLAGFGMLALGVVAALAGIVVGFIPARRS